MDTTPAAFTLRAAELRDLQDLVALIGVLAEYERLAHLVEATPDKLGAHLFGARPAAEALVAETSRGKVVGFALFFTNFSTFLCKPGLYLEDLFVLPDWRICRVSGAALDELAG